VNEDGEFAAVAEGSGAAYISIWRKGFEKQGDSYPVFVINGYAKLSKTTHTSTSDEVEDITGGHPSSPSCIIRRTCRPSWYPVRAIQHQPLKTCSVTLQSSTVYSILLRGILAFSHIKLVEAGRALTIVTLVVLVRLRSWRNRVSRVFGAKVSFKNAMRAGDAASVWTFLRFR
jgi:hypothetical protein